MRQIEHDGLSEQHEGHPLVVGVVRDLVLVGRRAHSGVGDVPATQAGLVVVAGLDYINYYIKTCVNTKYLAKVY